MSETKDYSLLRPFDLEAAKRGEAVCDRDHANEYEFLAIGEKRFSDGYVAVRLTRSFIVKAKGYIYLCYPEDLRMAPICWVEGRPVYRGDVLYETIGGGAGNPYVAHHFENGKLVTAGVNSCPHHYNPDHLTWTPPKVKRNVKLVAFIDEQGFLRWVREELFANRGLHVPTADMTIIVEEPTEVAK